VPRGQSGHYDGIELLTKVDDYFLLIDGYFHAPQESKIVVGHDGRLAARPSQPAAAARAGWYGPLGDLCRISPSSVKTRA
jgi:hypothetical protein